MSFIVLIVLALGMSGCAFGEALSHRYKSTNASAPSSLDSNPMNTGVVLLDFKVIDYRSWFDSALVRDVTYAAIQLNEADSDVLYSGGSTGFMGLGGGIPGFLFEGLKPGKYRVVYLGARSTSHTFSFNTSNSHELIFDVEAEKLKYVGRFTAHIAKDSISYTWEKERNRELEVWQTIKDQYSPSRWDMVINEKIKSLQGDK